jgi:hypothetical protein
VISRENALSRLPGFERIRPFGCLLNSKGKRGAQNSSTAERKVTLPLQKVTPHFWSLVSHLQIVVCVTERPKRSLIAPAIKA